MARREPLKDLNRFKAEFAQYVESFVASTISDSLTTHQRQAISSCWDDYLASVAANGGIVLPSKISVECDEIVLKKIQYLLRHLFHFRITISDAENSPSKNTIISTTMHRRFPLDWSSVLVSCLSYLQINIILYVVLKEKSLPFPNFQKQYIFVNVLFDFKVNCAGQIFRFYI